MKIETLKKSHLKRNIMLGVVAVLIISAVILNFTRAKYRTTQSIPLVNGTINYSLADLNAVAIYINGDSGYTKADTIPDGYVLNESESYCTINGEKDTSISLSYDTATKSLSVTPMTTKGTKCYLYFDEQKILLKDAILANSELKTDTPDFSKTSCTNGSNNGGNCGEETVGIYEETTSKGKTYYYRGDVENNYLVFADKYWRIIRINEDGTVRIIYSGEKSEVDAAGKETVLANGYDDSSTDYTQIQYSAFNSSYNASYYVGYTYTEGLQRPSTQNGVTASTIKGILDSWYSNNLQSYDNKIASGGSAGFCNDRNTRSGDSWVSSGTTFYYAAYERRSNGTPSYECSNTNDLYTTKIGLITADEVMYAGAAGTTSNYGYYLYTGNYYWTMSPYGFFGSVAWEFAVDSAGNLNNWYMTNAGPGVRPVISLKADVAISSGNGTSETPYVVS